MFLFLIIIQKNKYIKYFAPILANQTFTRYQMLKKQFRNPGILIVCSNEHNKFKIEEYEYIYAWLEYKYIPLQKIL